MLFRLTIIPILTLSVLTVKSQDSLQKFPADYLEKVNARASHLEQELDKKTDKVLFQMMKQEQKMKKKLIKIDSLKAKEIFGNVEQKYKSLEASLKNKLPGAQYIPSLDTLSTSLKFLQQYPQFISDLKGGEQRLKDALNNVSDLQDKFQKAHEIKTFLKDRKQFLKDQLSQFDFMNLLMKLNKQVYYYSQQLNEYKAMLTDRGKAERKAIELLTKTKVFNDFMRKNSMLASMFQLPGDPNDPLAQSNLAGLQTRVQVNNLIQQQIAVGGPGAQQQFSQNVQDAQAKLSELQNKILRRGSGMGGSSDDIMPEGFKPNDQKTKSFWKRLEYGTNFQTQKASGYFPITSDIGLSVGYKLNDKSVIGIGASYKLGWGQGWNHIKFTSEGMGLRSYVDWKIKGDFYLAGGYEQNYKTAFNSVDQLRDLNEWQQSGLIGLSKPINIRSKLFKGTKLHLLWDFLSYRQKPQTQPVVLRVGYNF